MLCSQLKMKFLWLSMIATFAIVAPNAVALLGPELVLNGDMEAGTNNWLGWDAAVSADTSVFHSGSQSLMITNLGGAIDGEGYQNGLAIEAGKSYHIDFWFAASANIYAVLNPLVGTSSSFADLASGVTWTHYTYDYTFAPGTMTQGQIAFFPVAAGSVAHVDDISVREILAVPEPSSAMLLAGAGLLGLGWLRRQLGAR